ncbi:hypothetical protein [Massilia sp. CF038]|uniref:hypothetical protein n=1 Tax=Massilia sp. CF038 TaxID=1881045 RepID=UPI00091B7FA9|nr:hypothetical protein [Massilia sp. CF038]SHG55453.1 hypothetical protein SAMN05428948_1003 [Massilia sp. CF038]
MPKVIFIAALSCLLSACALLLRPPPPVGATAAEVQAAWGRPTARYTGADGEVLEYAKGPMGQQTWMARMGPDGRLRQFEQVLTDDKFGTLKPGRSTQAEVLRAVGRPTEKSYLDIPKLQVWSYRYRESEVWNSMMHLHFNHDGVLTMMMNGPDPMYEYNDSSRD